MQYIEQWYSLQGMIEFLTAAGNISEYFRSILRVVCHSSDTGSRRTRRALAAVCGSGDDAMVLCCLVRRWRFLSALLLVLSACARSFAYYYERSQFDSSVVLVADVGQLEQSDFSVTEYWRCFVIIGTTPDAQNS